jgi:hypothetical protein
MPQIKNPISSKSSNKVNGKRAIFPHMDTEEDLWYRYRVEDVVADEELEFLRLELRKKKLSN